MLMTDQPAAPERDTTRTLPWSDDEYLLVDGFALVYTAGPDGLLVRLPGGRCATVPELREQHIVVMPLRIRGRA